MFKILKNFFPRSTRSSGRESALTKEGATENTSPSADYSISPISPIRPISPMPSSSAEGANPNPQSEIPDPPTARNGKIAKLPRHLRDQINQRLDAGQTVISIAQWLNELPEVKAMLETHFEGRP